MYSSTGMLSELMYLGLWRGVVGGLCIIVASMQVEIYAVGRKNKWKVKDYSNQIINIRVKNWSFKRVGNIKYIENPFVTFCVLILH